jgi:hypothetical protein
MTRRVAVLLMTAGVSAFAQPDPRYRSWGREALDRVRADTDRAERDLHYLPADEYDRFNKTRGEIREFQHRWEEGRYDKGALDHIIENLNHVVQHGRIHARDRDILADDVRRLRELRERWDHERR